MSSGRKRDDQFSELRRQAETILLDRIAMAQDPPAALSASDALRALHELSVHQVELEMQKEELQRALEELERLNQLHSAMTHVSQSIVRSSTEKELLDMICKVMVEFGKFDQAWIGWRDPDTGAFRVESRSGDGAADPPGSGCSFAVPLRKAGGVQGLLSVRARGQEHLGDRERALLEEAAEGVSFALNHLDLDAQRRIAYARLSEANARLRSLTLELTRTEQRERHRLAQMLHDHLQQELVGATFSIETLRGQTRAQAALKTLGNLAETIHRAIDISRDLTVELSPPVFQEKGLGGGLEWLARQARKHYGLQVAVELDGNLEPDTEAVRMFIFEAVRELLLNVVKHARAEQASIRMRPSGDGGIAITVEDDGIGFDPSRLEAEASPAGGMGLFSIRERLRFLQGGMDITSRPGGGSSLTLMIPIRARTDRMASRAAGGGLRDGDQDPHRR